jgi:predicted RNase H-like HicB family nuclease
MDYIAIIHKDWDSDFGVSFPDFPGCITAGRTLDEAKEMAREALSGHIALMREAGEALPEPSSLDQVMSDPQFRDGAAFLVDPGKPVKTERVNSR